MLLPECFQHKFNRWSVLTYCTFNEWLTTHHDRVISRHKCLWMYCETTLTHPVNTCKWRLIYEQTLNDNIVKQSCKIIEYVFVEEVMIVDKYVPFIINTWKPITINHFNLVLWCLFMPNTYLSPLMSNLSLRIRCPSNCKTQPSYWSPVVGNNIYTDVSNTMNFFTNWSRSPPEIQALQVRYLWALSLEREKMALYMDLHHGEVTMGSRALWCVVVMESDWITVWIWLMENGSNGEVSLSLPGMYYPEWGWTTYPAIISG